MSSARKLRLVHTQTKTEAPVRQARTRTASRVRQAHRYPRAELEEAPRVLEAPDYEVVYVERRSQVIEAQLIDIEQWMDAPAVVEAPIAPKPERQVVRHTLPSRGNTTITMAPLARTKAALGHDEHSIISLPEDRRRALWGWTVGLCSFLYVAWALIP